MDKTNNLSITVGQRITTLRKEKNMSREYLASLVDVSLDTIGNYERGDTSMKINSLADVANALGVDPGIILSDNRHAVLMRYEKLNDEHKAIIKNMIEMYLLDERHKLP